MRTIIIALAAVVFAFPAAAQFDAPQTWGYDNSHVERFNRDTERSDREFQERQRQLDREYEQRIQERQQQRLDRQFRELENENTRLRALRSGRGN